MLASLALGLTLGLWPANPAAAQVTVVQQAVETGRPVPVSKPEVPAMHVPAPVVPVRFQMGIRGSADESQPFYQIQLEPPGLQQLAQGMQSDATLQERIRQQTLSNPATANERVDFPDEPILSYGRYAGRGPLWQQRSLIVEPHYVNYWKLLYEDKNAERYGWDLGEIQPVVSYGLFLWDTVLLPLHLFNDPCRKTESSAGYCLPGDSTPYLLYPPQVTLTGALAEVAVIVALAAIFP
jgi:hypothetical protein